MRPQDVWIGKHRRCQYAIVDFQEYRLDRLHLPVPLGLHDFDWSPAQRERIQATMQRELLGWQTGPVELQQLIRFYQRWFATLLLHHGIAQVWFAYIPHEGAALILYEVAQSLGLRTRMFYQSLMANRAFLVEQVETLGKLPATPGTYPPFAETFSYGQPEQDLFYMRSLPPVLGQRAFFWRSYWPRLKARLRGKVARLGVVALAAGYGVPTIFVGLLRGLSPELFHTVIVLEQYENPRYLTVDTAPMPVSPQLLAHAAQAWQSEHPTQTGEL